MAAGTAANVTTGKHRIDGGIFLAPAGTALPTDAATALATAFKNLGFISEDGVTIQIQRTNEDIKEWNGDVVDTLGTEHSALVKTKFIESLNTDTLKLVYGNDNVTEASGALTVHVNSKDLNEYVMVIDTVVKGDRKQRRVLPRAKLTELGDIVLKAGEAIAYDATIAAFPGADGDKIKIYTEAAAS